MVLAEAKVDHFLHPPSIINPNPLSDILFFFSPSCYVIVLQADAIVSKLKIKDYEDADPTLLLTSDIVYFS